jgi:hypothetical protein
MLGVPELNGYPRFLIQIVAPILFGGGLFLFALAYRGGGGEPVGWTTFGVGIAFFGFGLRLGYNIAKRNNEREANDGSES